MTTDTDTAELTTVNADESVVLVVDDIDDTLEFYTDVLRDEYRVKAAHDGASALDELDETVDVVLLDRRMPGRSGYEVVNEIRERDYDVRIVMVTATEPDFDIVDVGFDDYVTKPVSVAQLRETVEQMVDRSEYDDRFQEYFALASKKAALEENKTSTELGKNERYDQLENRLRELNNELDEAIGQLERQRPGTSFRELL